MPAAAWKDRLAGKTVEAWAHEIDIYEGQLKLKKDGKIDDKVIAETRLRRGVYGQRYDNGQRHDGAAARELAYPSADLLKGPETLWDAPGMQRIKIPYGGVTPEQLEVIADLSEEYSDGILHVTTRQDFQLHFVHIEDTPDLMRRLAAVGVTTREACGNSVRNVTGCPLAGVCRTEAFDVAPYASALMRFLLGHPDVQDFGRKFKPAFSGCEHEACGLVSMHDLGFVARLRDGKRGFMVVVGGGLGAVPHQAKVLSEFTPAEEILPLSQAISRVFARLGEKKNRARARIKFLVAKLGIDEFRRLVEEERKVLPQDERWTAYLKEVPEEFSRPLRPASPLFGLEGLIPPAALASLAPRPGAGLPGSGNGSGNGGGPRGFQAWAATNVYRQRQPGYAVAVINCPLGDITSVQARALADLSRKYVGDNLRTTVEQNLVLRWVSETDLPALHAELESIGLGEPGAGTIVDITACPGTDTCKLGIASSRGLAAELRQRLTAKSASLPQAVKDLKIKISGCFNSCGQHHVADIGFYGNSRTVNNRTVPHFQVVLGGQWQENAGSYGLAMGAVPSKAIPAVIDALTGRYVRERSNGERFQDFIQRLGKKELRGMLEPLMPVPDYTVRPDYYTDWGDPREFTIGDMGTGECAGEVVSVFSMEISKAESENFDAQIELEQGRFEKAEQMAYRSMLMAAQALVRTRFQDVGDDADEIVAEFRKRFVDTQLFFDRFMKGQFAQYLLLRHETPPARLDRDAAHQRVEEAQLFMEAARACEARLKGVSVGGAAI
jgi:sulfite reductase (ferredoxin)